MCNLSQKIKETGIETGIEIGKKEMIVKMHSKGYTIAQIADVAGMEEKRIEEIENLQAQLDAQLSLEEVYTNVSRLMEINNEKSALDDELLELMEKWEALESLE